METLITKDFKGRRYVETGDVRPPKSGEWFFYPTLGAVRAYMDFTTSYPILREVGELITNLKLLEEAAQELRKPKNPEPPLGFSTQEWLEDGESRTWQEENRDLSS